MAVHTKAMLAKALRQKLNISKDDAEMVIDELALYIKDLPVNSRLELRGLGVFSRKPVSMMNKHNPVTGEKVPNKTYSTIRFKASTAVRKTKASN